MKTDNFNRNYSIFFSKFEKSDSGGCHGNGGSNQFFFKKILVFSGNDHSVKVSSNSEMDSGTALWEFFGFLRELVLSHTISPF